MNKHINIGILGVCDVNKKTLAKDIAEQLKKAYMCDDDKHKFKDANDGTGDKVCVICGIRAKQAVMRFK